ncbi:PREDICTED: uncharacterized protein LOC108663670 [Theobroma cacao]|uniref:Uncharacterized protein LOC108663670 n=1 Tax=Theobroma cacao TaxID=3641 RepID=A0AB32WXN2_THECC|nr:PREDICTED: uncharacterized protein LOC108663670 [Theobroma cacao]
MAYGCEQCFFWLHESCAREIQHLPPKIIHPFHSQHHLELKFKHWFEDFICDKCLYISAGSTYNCHQCDFNFHLTCASSTDDLLPEEEWERLKDGKKKETPHYSHLHKLTIFKYRKIREFDYNCSWCEKSLSEVCYGCLKLSILAVFRYQSQLNIDITGIHSIIWTRLQKIILMNIIVIFVRMKGIQRILFIVVKNAFILLIFNVCSMRIKFHLRRCHLRLPSPFTATLC